MSKYKFLKHICLFALPVLLFACRDEVAYVGDSALASIGDKHLYRDEVALAYARQGHLTDSAEFVRNYIERWAGETLFYEKAKENVPSTAEIDRMVENYRMGLLLKAYQDGLITQQLAPAITDKDVKAFYEKEKGLFELEESYIKGFYIKLPKDAPYVSSVRNRCIRKKPEDLDHLEKLCVEKGYAHQFFIDEWVLFNELVRRTPLTAQQLMTRLQKNKTIEFCDKGYTYFISAFSIMRKGGQKPLEMVSDEVRELLLNSRKAEFIKTVKRSMYEKALEEGRVVLH